jgi:hypothetical protein
MVVDSVAETMVVFVATLAAASYGHFGVTLKDSPTLHHQHTQRSHQPIVQRIPASLAVQPGNPCPDAAIAERAVVIRKA